MNCRSAFQFCISLAALFAGSAFAAENYVVISVNPDTDGLFVGKHYVPDDTIVIPPNVTISLLGEDGSVENLEGPASYVVTKEKLPAGESESSREEDQGKLAVIGYLLASENRRIESVGGTRGAGGLPKPLNIADPWAIPVDTSGQGCLRDGKVLIWRRDATETLRFAIRVGDSQRDGLVWHSSENIFDASSYVPDSAQSFTIERDLSASQMSLNRMPTSASPANPLDTAAWMARSGCKQQAFAFVRQLAGH